MAHLMLLRTLICVPQALPVNQNIGIAIIESTVGNGIIETVFFRPAVVYIEVDGPGIPETIIMAFVNQSTPSRSAICFGRATQIDEIFTTSVPYIARIYGALESKARQ